MSDSILLEVNGVSKTFSSGRGRSRHEVHAVRDASFEIAVGETFGLVGESGSGKSTLARLILRLLDVDKGAITLAGHNLVDVRGRTLRELRRRAQMVFQDPYSSLDPSWTVLDIVGEPLRVHSRLPKTDRAARVAELLTTVELPGDILDRYPHEFSGGQRQRLAIARALALAPDLIVCDEAVSALDVSTQAAVLNLLRDLQDERGLAYLFISHDLSVIRHVSDRVAVMFHGSIVEIGDATHVCDTPSHPYSKLLRDSVPVVSPDPEAVAVQSPQKRPPRPDPTVGCVFYERCPIAEPRCATTAPELQAKRSGALVACHLVE